MFGHRVVHGGRRGTPQHDKRVEWKGFTVAACVVDSDGR